MRKLTDCNTIHYFKTFTSVALYHTIVKCERHTAFLNHTLLPINALKPVRHLNRCG